jgi:transcriptional regulator with XRE-family HTH domain
MAPRQPSRPEPKGEKTGKTKSRIKRQLAPRGKYRPRKASSIPKTPGERIRASRLALGLTQKELGERLLTDQTTVSAWERGKSEKLAGPSLVALAMVLQTTPEAILTGVKWERPGPSPTPTASDRAAEPYASDLVHLPAAPKAGEAVWVSRDAPDHHQAMGNRMVQAELKKALGKGRPVWVVVG